MWKRRFEDPMEKHKPVIASHSQSISLKQHWNYRTTWHAPRLLPPGRRRARVARVARGAPHAQWGGGPGSAEGAEGAEARRGPGDTKREDVGGFLKSGIPRMDGLWGKIRLKWMIWGSIWLINTGTGDGRNLAPVDRFIPLFIGFQPSKVVQDFFHPP